MAACKEGLVGGQARLASQLAVHFCLLPIGRGCFAVRGCRLSVLSGLYPVVLPGATIGSGGEPLIPQGVKRPAQVYPRELCGSHRHFVVDHRLLIGRGPTAMVSPQVLPLRLCLHPKALSPKTVPNRLVTLGPLLVTKSRPLVAILGVLVPPCRGNVTTLSGLVASEAAARRIHALTVPPQHHRHSPSLDLPTETRSPERTQRPVLK